MKLYLRDVETFPAQVCLEAGPNAIVADFDGLCSIEKVTVELGIQQSGDEYFCQAAVAAGVVLECVRCLAHYEAQLQGRVDFIVCSEATHAEQRAEGTDDEDYVFYQGESLEADITDIVRQTIILAVPMKPICSEDCKGLCPYCKVNRNETDCDCRNDEIDERWAGLRDLPRN